MTSHRFSYAALALGALASGAFAQVDDALICDATNGRVYRTQDLDGDGLADDFNECVLFFSSGDLEGNDSAPGSPSPLGIISVDTRVDAGVAAVYWTSGFGGAADAVGRGTDLDGDGRITSAEMTLFWDAGGQGFDIDADGLALTGDGAVWVSSDFDGDEGVWRLMDTNADGVADTVSRMVDGGSGFTVGYGADNSGAAASSAASGDDFQWLTAISNTAVIGYEGYSSNAPTSEDCIFRLEDMNGDGDVQDGLGDTDPLNDEARLFLNYIGKSAVYPVNPDFGTVLRSPGVDPVMSGSTGASMRLMHTGHVDQFGVSSYFFASETSSASSFNLNVDSPALALNGLIYLGVDGNNDNDVNDAGEVTLFYDGSTSGGFQGIDKILGVRAIGDWLYVHDLANGSKAVHRFQDMNGNGDAMDAGESEFFVFDSVSYDPSGFGAPVIPFTDPAPPVYSLDAGLMPLDIGFVTTGGMARRGDFAPVNNWFDVTGEACSTFDNSKPKQSMSGVPRIDSTPGGSAAPVVFSAQNTGALAGDLLIMYGSTNASTYLSVPLPLDLSIFNTLWGGCSLYVNPQYPNYASANAAGGGSVSIGIPNVAALVGARLFTQWLNLSSAGLPGAVFSLSGLGTFVVEL